MACTLYTIYWIRICLWAIYYWQYTTALKQSQQAYPVYNIWTKAMSLEPETAYQSNQHSWDHWFSWVHVTHLLKCVWWANSLFTYVNALWLRVCMHMYICVYVYIYIYISTLLLKRTNFLRTKCRPTILRGMNFLIKLCEYDLHDHLQISSHSDLFVHNTHTGTTNDAFVTIELLGYQQT